MQRHNGLVWSDVWISSACGAAETALTVTGEDDRRKTVWLRRDGATKKAEWSAPPLFKFRLAILAGQLQKGNDDLQDDPDKIQNQSNQFHHFPSPSTGARYSATEALTLPAGRLSTSCGER
ncbi:hypothetical protein [Pantoea septica]|uniref:hypothetical protein n=1 Tax=Pantoea septica TaxID=472695 RepID=UPI001C0F55CB|nr:hypothetical protein [Pantoea septica]MBU5377974.1 hypothetical protein [Pantoea septica]MDU5836097.1 hypothetical protein [Pantoea sp.]